MSSVQMLEGIKLVMWNLPTGIEQGPKVGAVRSLVESLGLPLSAVYDVGEATAFRRACDHLCQEEESNLRVTFAGKDTLIAQFDRIDGTTFDSVQTHKAIVVRLTDAGPQVVVGGQQYQSFFDSAYEYYRTTYKWPDLTSLINRLFRKHGAGAYSPRDCGGVYFVPGGAPGTMLDKVAQLCEALQVRLLQYGVPDTAAQRDAVADAIGSTLLATMEEHAVAVDAYQAGIRGTILDARLAALEAFEANVNSLREFIRPAVTIQLGQDLTRLRARIAEVRAMPAPGALVRRVVPVAG